MRQKKTTRDHPLLLGGTLDNQVKDYVTELRVAAGVVDTALVLAAAEVSNRTQSFPTARGRPLLLGRNSCCHRTPTARRFISAH